MSSLYEINNDSPNLLPIKLYKHALTGIDIWAPLHWHRSIEILVAFNGKMAFHCGTSNFDIVEDDWFVINSSTLHSSRYLSLDDHFEGISILISLPFIEKWIGPNVTFDNPSNDSVSKDIIEIAHALYSHDSSQDFQHLFLMEKAFALINILSKSCIVHEKTRIIPFLEEHKKASEFLSYIEQNYLENLTLDNIAEYFQYSPNYFSRYFKELLGINFTAYLNSVRVNHATQELLETHSTIIECASNNGFPNSKSFIAAFKKMYNCTPKEFLND